MRKKHRDEVNKILWAETTGRCYTDEYWEPIHRAFRRIREAGFEVNVTRAEYDWDGERLIGKTWTFEVNHPATSKPLYGTMRACAAGTVENPMGRYDVAAYVC